MNTLIIMSAFVVCMMCVGRMHRIRYDAWVSAGGALHIHGRAMRQVVNEWVKDH